MSLLIGYLQDRLTELANLNQQKKVLSYHKGFNILNLYKELDEDEKGYITAQDFRRYFTNDQDLRDQNFGLLIAYWNGNNDDSRLYLEQLNLGLCSHYDQQYLNVNPLSKGKDYPRQSYVSKPYSYDQYGQGRYAEQQLVRETAYVENMEVLWRAQISLIFRLSADLAYKDHFLDPKQAALTYEDAHDLWIELDTFRQGSVTAEDIQKWLVDTCSYHIPLYDCHYLYKVFRSEKGRRVSRDQFVVSLSGRVQPERASKK